MKTHYIYILTNKSRATLYIGVTNDISRRLYEHRYSTNKSFVGNYQLHRLVYVEEIDDVYSAIAREKQLKNWRRQWKINLIESQNPQWSDLAKLYGMDPEINSG